MEDTLIGFDWLKIKSYSFADWNHSLNLKGKSVTKKIPDQLIMTETFGGEGSLGYQCNVEK